MHHDMLHPPNLQTLSADVIGNVQLRARVSSRNFGPNDMPDHQPTPAPSAALPPTTSGESVTTDAAQVWANNAAYLRERGRKSQQRYRDKQNQLITDLELSKKQLERDVQQLKRNRESISSRLAAKKETMWSVAVEYFRLFRCGLIASEGVPSFELEFMRATMTSDLDAGTVSGIEALARNWKVFTQFFSDVQIHLERLEQVAENVLVATTTTILTITESSLCDAFPHLTSRTAWKRIAAKLLGQKLVMRGSVYFSWDNESKRVVSLITKADMVTPLLQLLGNLEDVSSVFSVALVAPDCNLVVGEYLYHHKLCC